MRARRAKTALLALCLPLAACAASLSGTTGDQTIPPMEIGYITRVYERDGERMIDVDRIEWLTGDAAEAALRADDPTCAEDHRGCTPPNGYYVRNQEKTAQPLALGPGTTVFLQTFDPARVESDRPVTVREFLDVVRGEGGGVAERFKRVPFWIQRAGDGSVASIREQYIP